MGKDKWEVFLRKVIISSAEKRTRAENMSSTFTAENLKQTSSLGGFKEVEEGTVLRTGVSLRTM